MVTTKKYPASQLWTMITELLHELGLEKYTVLDVVTFGYNPDAMPSVFVEVFTRDGEGNKIGTEVITRFIEYDVPYGHWGVPPTDYPVIA